MSSFYCIVYIVDFLKCLRKYEEILMTWFWEIKKKKLFLLAKPFIIKVAPNN